jgi:ABC-type transport system involved in multi-copper enzyme maturation permease subunit
MTTFLSAFWAETLKACRSKVSWVTAAAFSVFPIVGGLFMVIMKDPAKAQAMGLIGAKAQLLSGGEANWQTYLDFLGVGTAAAGAILFAFIVAWIFGREFSDHTAKELLALPRGARRLSARSSFWPQSGSRRLPSSSSSSGSASGRPFPFPAGPPAWPGHPSAP